VYQVPTATECKVKHEQLPQSTPAWVAIVSGFTHEPNLSPEEAFKRLVPIAISVAVALYLIVSRLS
jgi:hypothetical protein